MIKVMVFGTFDGVHEGHRYFLREARREGDSLTVVVARDMHVHDLKGRHPEYHEADRMELIRGEDGVDHVMLGDEELGSWQVIRQHKPHVIALGHDQKALRDELESTIGDFWWTPEIRVIAAWKPEQFHNAKLKPKPGGARKPERKP